MANQLYCLVLGEYRVGLKFNDQHVPDSPFKVYISPAAGDAHLLEVAQFPEGAVQADKPAQFIVRKNGAKGDLDAKVSEISRFIYVYLSVYRLYLDMLSLFYITRYITRFIIKTLILLFLINQIINSK